MSMRRMGAVTRPTSSSRLGNADPEVEGGLQAVCLGFVRQSRMQRRAKSNVKSEPASVGIRWAVPSVGHGARDATQCSLVPIIAMVDIW